MIREIGAHARRRIEAFLGEPVYLDLWVKTLPRWRSRAAILRRLGFDAVPTRSR
jgi:GTP-binding protein Era